MIISISATPAELDGLLDQVAAKIAAQLQPQFTQLQQEGQSLMATITDVQTAVANETTVEQSAITLLQQLSQMLQAALAANDPAQVQAVVDQINANAQALSDAVAANTPAAPATP